MTNPKAFLVTESEILDPAALAAYTPTVRAALMAAGGRPAVINSIGGRINLVVSEWPSLAAAQAWVRSAELAAVEPRRAKAYRIIRQYIVEMRA